MKALVLIPIVAVGLWVLARKVRGHPVSRADLRVLVGLLVAVYLVATAALGIFWVSRMELPVFDWHYLVGYCLLLAAAWHLWLEWPQVLSFIRRQAQLTRGRGVRWVVGGAVILLVALGLLWLRGQPGGSSAVEPRPEVSGASGAALPTPTPSEPLVATSLPPVAGSEATEAVRYLLRESSASLTGLVRRGLLFGPKVPSLRDVRGQTLLHLPPPAGAAPQGLAASLSFLVQPSSPRCGAPSLAELATILYAAAGVTEVRSFGLETLYLRAAPSAGALYPVEAYLVVLEADQLPAGVYAYVPQDHALLPVGGVPDPVRWARALGWPEQARVSGPLVVLTTVFQRTVWKYGSRSYRYVALDAGHAVANLWLAAAALSWPMAVTPFFSDPEVEAALNLAAEEEGAMAVGVFGQLPSAPRALPAFAETHVEGRWDSAELTRLSHRLTRWQWSSGTPWVWQPRALSAGPKPVAGSPDLLTLIKKRRSFRRFSPEPLAAGQMATVLERLPAMAACLPGGDGIELRVVVVRDQGLPAGVYRWRGGLELLRAGNFGRALYRAGLSQELLDRAAAAVVFCLDERSLASAFGRRGLRLGLLAAGALGEVVYLAAGESGLKACGVGAFADDELSRLLQLPEGTTPVYLVALGKG